MANEVTKFNIGGVDHAVKDEGARTLIATLQQALDALTGEDTTTAIETFQEVLDFLAGVTDDETLAGKITALNTAISAKYTKPNDGIPSSDLASAVQTILSSVSGKAEKSEMSVTDGTGANADKTMIQLKSGTTATVLKSHQSLSNYVQKDGDKVLSDNNYTDAEKTKLGGIAAGAEVNTIEGIIVNGTEVTPDSTTKKVSITSTAGKSAYQSYLDTTEDDPAMTEAEWVASLKGDKGDAGNVTVSDGVAEIDIVNDLTTGGAGDALSAEMGLVLRREITRVHDDLVTLYGKLANMAFWNATDRAAAEPRNLNFNVPQVSLVFDLTGVGTGVSVKLNGESINSPVSVDKGGTNTLTIQAIEDWALNNDIAVEIGGVSQTLTETGGIYSLEFSANANVSIEVVGTATQIWFTAPKSDVIENGTIVTYGMQQGRSIQPTYGYMTDSISSNAPNIIATPAGLPTPSGSNNRIFTTDGGSSNANGPGATTQYFFATGGAKKLHIKIVDTGDTTNYYHKISVGCYGNSVIGSTYAWATKIAGFINRIQYTDANGGNSLEWVFDLHTTATSNGASAGDIRYIKLLIGKYPNGGSSAIDTRTWIDGATIKYKFTND